MEMGRGRRSMGRQLGQFLKTMGAASGVAPAMVASTGGASFKRRFDSGDLDSVGDSASSGGYGS
jgi:hypothetical protein